MMLTTSSCTSSGDNNTFSCMPTDPCWHKYQTAYVLHNKCLEAKSEAEKRYFSAARLDIYIRHGKGWIRCR